MQSDLIDFEEELVEYGGAEEEINRWSERDEEEQERWSKKGEELQEADSMVVSNVEDNSDQDPWALLAQKERDLILAAELGKALLERNEELHRKNEEIQQETNARIEAVEQDKHVLQQNFALRESEFESVILELRSDNQEMQKQIRSQSEAHLSTDKQRQSAVGDLSEQNQRLTQQLREAAATEEQLQAQIQSLRDQFNAKRSSFNEYQMQMEALKQEVSLLSDRKHDLEKRLRVVTEERDAGLASLEETNDRVMVLERQLKEQEQQIMSQDEEIQEVKNNNSNLEDKIERMSIQMSSPNPHAQNQSLFSELEMSSASDCGESNLFSLSQPKGLKTPSHSPYRRSPAHRPKQGTRSFGSMHVQLADEEYECDDEDDEDGVSSSDPSDDEQLNALNGNSRKPKSKQKITADSLKKMVNEKDAEVERLQGKITVLEAQLSDSLRSKSDERLKTQEDLLSQAWEERDAALDKQHQLELQLTQAKVDLMNLDSQLMEAIQQKIELSQQLERWEIDLETLIEYQVKKKMERVTHEEYEEEMKMEEEKEVEKGKSLRSRVARRLFKTMQ